jgi:radical SAM protein with 4Fe4S-binding SPASM domain
MRVIQNREYISFFDENTGGYIRTGILRDGKDTGEDPFMADFPELLDVGIMGHCMHGRTGLCVQAGIECYQNGLTVDNPNMKLEDFARIAEQCKGKTFQFALGGCGDPDQHEHFEEILKICTEYNIVPNFTTSGLGLTEEKARIAKKYCGAVAVSWYRSEYTLGAINLLLKCGVKTNIHYVLTEDTLGEALQLLERGSDGFPRGINAVVFLLHKPVGQGTREKMVKVEDGNFWKLLHFADENRLPFRVGFDSCTVPALLGAMRHTDFSYLDTCEGGRWSAYISSDMKMMPCSFAREEEKYHVSLQNHSIAEAWNSREFDLFREHLRSACPGCGKRSMCMGGCPIVPEIVLCEEKNHGK